MKQHEEIIITHCYFLVQFLRKNFTERQIVQHRGVASCSKLGTNIQ